MAARISCGLSLQLRIDRLLVALAYLPLLFRARESVALARSAVRLNGFGARLSSGALRARGRHDPGLKRETLCALPRVRYI